MSELALTSAQVVPSASGGVGLRRRRGLRLLVGDPRGRVGLGEAAPLPGRSRESFDEVAAALDGWARRVHPPVDLDAPLVPQIEARLEDLVPTARFAVESALYDLVGQATERSVAELLGGPARPAAVALNATLDLEAWRTGFEKIDALVRCGFATFKVKAGDSDFGALIVALERLRQRVGASVGLRLDVGGGWSFAEAPAHLQALVPLGLEYVEQPVGPDELARLPRPAVSLAADESLERPGGLEAIIAADNCAAVVLKPAFLGGLGRARRLAQRAQEAGLGVVVTHAFDGPVALAAAAELALSLDPPPLACGLARHEGLASWPALDAPQLDDAVLRAPAASGLGFAAAARRAVLAGR